MARKGKNGLTDQRQSFVDHYLAEPEQNATNAYQKAYPKAKRKSAEALACNLLKVPKVAAAIQLAMDKRAEKADITAEMVLREIAKLAFGNIKNLYGKDGKLIPVNELPVDVAATLTEVTEKQLGKGDDAPILERKYKAADKKASLELLGKHLKLFTDKIEHTGADGGPIETITSDMDPKKASKLYQEMIEDK